MAQFLEICETAARAGGRVLLDWRGKIEAREKGPKDLVTQADLASQKIIQETLLSAFPDHHFVGEEGGAGDVDQLPSPDDYCWICDPLDGTTNYVHQLPNYCVSIALRRGDELLVGVVFDPTANECFSAVSGAGAFLNGQPIQVSDCTETSRALVAVSLPTQVKRDGAEIPPFLELLASCQAVRRLGSAALNLCYLAAGRLDGYWATDTRIWDVAAGVLVVREAGGRVSGSRGGPFQLGTPGLLAACTATLNQRLAALVA